MTKLIFFVCLLILNVENVEKISTMQMLKPITDVLKHYNNKCPSCGQKLSTSEFSLDIEKK